MTLEPRDVLGFIERESAAAAATIAQGSLDARVPSCPDWSLAELIWHLGRGQRFWASAMRAGDVDPEFPTEEPGPPRADELAAWFRPPTAGLPHALLSVSW